MNKYFDGNKVIKEKVAMDIKYRELDKNGIDRLLAIPGVESSFVGTVYKKKIPSEQWNESYLDSLSYSAVTECFNKDYLYYLNQVAEFIAENKRKKKNVWLCIGIIGFALLLALLLIISHIIKDNNGVRKQVAILNEVVAVTAKINEEILNSIAFEVQ